MINKDRCSFLEEFWRELLKNKIAVGALCVTAIYVLSALSCEIYSICYRFSDKTPIYDKGSMEQRYQAPSTEHWLGTDYKGRNVFWRAFFAIRTAMKVGLVASLISAVIGVGLGVIAGYFGGWVDDLVVWIYSTFASMPTLLFILAFALLIGKGFIWAPLGDLFKSCAFWLNTESEMLAVYLGIGLTGWVSLCRVVRAEAMRIREASYIQAAKSLGFNPFRIITKHVIPNLAHLVIIYVTMRFAYAIMTEVIVSYLGLGVQMEPSWGTMIADGQQRLWQGIWWEAAAATIFMFFLVLPLHLLGDALRDLLDPRLRF